MDTVDFAYRFDPRTPASGPAQRRQAARKNLEDGNRMFSQWMYSCRYHDVSHGSPKYIVQCNGLKMGMVRKQDEMPKQAPFAVVVGCSDARFPTEMLFGQGFNDLFVIRVAGNVMGDVCMGSIDFALSALSESVKVVVMLGHSGCGAVTGAVDSYLQPLKFWARTTTPMLRSIQERIFVAVREAANGIQMIWGEQAATAPGFRTALIESAVALKAAKREIEVLLGVFNLHNHQVSMPVVPDAAVADENVRLPYAPTNPKEFKAFSIQMAQLLKPRHFDAYQSGNHEPAEAIPVAE